MSKPPQEGSTARLTLELLDQELRKERQMRYALLAEHQSRVRSKDRLIEQLDRRLQSIRRSRWWRLRRRFIKALSRVWWIEDHKD